VAARACDLLGMHAYERMAERVLRAASLGLNVACNGLMWTLFTQALRLGESLGAAMLVMGNVMIGREAVEGKS
jgi:hypothetical protein